MFANVFPTDMKQVLVIDDDLMVCEVIGFHLREGGYGVEFVHDSKRGLELAQSGKYDAVLLDIVMPGMDGFEVLRELRMVSSVPVLMLTARGEETSIVKALESGADDYIPKPFGQKELLARLGAVLRRYRITSAIHQSSGSILRYGNLAINLDSHEVMLGHDLLELTPMEFSLLLYLAQLPDTVVSRNELLASVSDREYEVFDRAIDVHISSLRKKLGDSSEQPRFIKTVRGTGYRFLSGV